MSSQAANPVLDYASRAAVRSGSRRRRAAAMLVVCALLLAGALGLNASVAALRLSFRKEAVPLRKPVAAIPAALGSWVQLSTDSRLSAEMEQALGTQEYIQRIYVDTRHADPVVLSRWEAAPVKTVELRDELYQSVVSSDPLAVIRLHVAYYTGAVDTVPHIPERCMLAGGFDPVGRTQADLQLAGGGSLRASFVQFQERAGHAQPVTFSVGYLFQVNGTWEHDAVTGVRRRLQNLLERHAYFAKVEVMTQGPGTSPADAQRVMADFLSFAAPAVETVLPDWQDVIERQSD